MEENNLQRETVKWKKTVCQAGKFREDNTLQKRQFRGRKHFAIGAVQGRKAFWAVQRISKGAVQGKKHFAKGVVERKKFFAKAENLREENICKGRQHK